MTFSSYFTFHRIRQFPIVDTKSVLKNGFGVFVLPVKEVCFRYDSLGSTSTVLRQFLTLNLVNLANAYPSVEFIVEPALMRKPEVVAKYLNGRSKGIIVAKFKAAELEESIKGLLQTENAEPVKYSTRVESDAPAVRPLYSPFHDNFSSPIRDLDPRRPPKEYDPNFMEYRKAMGKHKKQYLKKLKQ